MTVLRHPNNQGVTLQQWRKTAAGGETSLTGTDDFSAALAYTVGAEEVFINGVLIERGVDYTATSGTGITLTNALVAGDLATVQSATSFNVANAIPKATVTAKGDLITATGASTVTNLAVGADGTTLVANSSASTGVSWQAPAMTFINSTSFSGVSAQNIDSLFSAAYDKYTVVVNITAASAANADLLLYFRSAGSNVTTNNNSETLTTYSTTLAGAERANLLVIGSTSTTYPTFSSCSVDIFNPYLSQVTTFSSNGGVVSNAGVPYQFRAWGYNFSTTSMTGLSLYPSSGTITGNIRVYGMRNS